MLDRSKQDFAQEVQQKFGKCPISLLIDSTGADILNTSFDLMRNLGHVISFGEASGKPYDNLWSQLVLRSLTFSRLHIGHLDNQSSDWLNAQKTLQEMIKNRKLKLFIEHIFSIVDFKLAYQLLASRKVSGKILLKTK